MASISMCQAAAATGRAVEEWAQSHPDHPAAGPILAAINPETWAHTQVTPAERDAAFAAAAAAGYYIGAADRQAELESEVAAQEADRYLRALGYR